MSSDPILIERLGSANWKDILSVLRVLNERQYQTLVGAEELGRERERILAEANRDADGIRELARQDGEKQGRDEVLSAWAETLAQWKGASGQYREAIRSVTEKEYVLVVDSACSLAEWILRRELREPESLRWHIVKMLADDPDESCGVLKVNPRQVAVVEGIMREVEQLRGVRIEADGSLEEGDMRLVYPEHEVEGRISLMLQQGARVLKREIRGPAK